MESNVSKYVVPLLTCDQHLSKFWKRRSVSEQRDYVMRWQYLESAVLSRGERLEPDHQQAVDLMCRISSVVHTTATDMSREPEMWHFVADHRQEQWRIYRRNKRRIERLMTHLSLNGRTRLYGGLKPYKSINRALYDDKSHRLDTPEVKDLWDLLRFRLVVPDFCTLVKTAITIWFNHFDEVIGCHNYYLYPRSIKNGYRAIHFTLADSDQAVFELQLMTYFRESVSLIDHAPKFKRSVAFFDENHEEWLQRMSYAANIIDAQDLESNTDAFRTVIDTVGAVASNRVRKTLIGS